MSEQGALSTTQWAVLALVCEQPTHGWSLVRLLARDGEIGRVWTVGRALVYGTIAQLEREGLLTSIRTERGGRGPRRTIVRATPAGREAARRWLLAPVEHVRDLRSDLLLKLLLGSRAGIDQTELLVRQQSALAAMEESLARALRSTDDGEERLLLAFRLETTKAANRFVAGLLESPARPGGPARTGKRAARA